MRSLSGVAEWVDEFAERVTALGGYATGTVRMAAAASTLPEFPTEDYQEHGLRPCRGGAPGGLHELCARGDPPGREAGDAKTADLFTEVSRCA